MSNLHPLEVVGRGGETQLQVCGHLDWNLNDDDDYDGPR